MLANIREIVRPATVEEAVERLGSAGGALLAMAGGTATSLFRSTRVEGIVDLWSLPLRYCREEGGELRIGATATMADLERSPAARAWAGGALAEAAGAAASTPLRNLITVGGNLAALYPWSDLPPLLLALGARARIAGPAGPELAVEELVARHPSKLLGHASLVTEVVVPALPPGAAAAFTKFGVSAVDYAWVSVACLVAMEGGVCRRCRLAVGAVEARCRRLPEVEELVVGAALDEERARAAGRLAAEVVRPIPDPRASEEYRRHLLAVVVGRTLLRARERAESGGGR
jgi:CO/xanthine dehydrogenase FAD-binding subunit